MRTVAIVGVGLIGGSFGLALKKAGFEGDIIGVSSDTALADARQRGAIDRGAPLAEAAREADLIYLAQPIGRIFETFGQLDPLVKPDALVTDAGSTKAEIVAAARTKLGRCQFLGGHPMAGKEKRGAAEAEADLFVGRTYVLTPASKGDLGTPRAKELLGWIERIGAKLLILEPQQHDRVVSFTSHLAQLASTALAATVSENLSEPEDLRAAGPGLADMTRLASSAFEIWRDILATNPAAIDHALAAYIARLEQIREHLCGPEMEEHFRAGADLARRFRR